jgi:hypothetical protein
MVSRIAKLTHQHDVGILAQRGAKRARERPGMHADLSLGDQALLALMHELDRILDREDVLSAGRVHQVDQRRERGRLAAAGRAGDEDESLGEVREALDLLAQSHLVGGAHLRRNRGGTRPSARSGRRPALARKRATPSISQAQSGVELSRYSALMCGLMIESNMCSSCWGSSAGASVRTRSPSAAENRRLAHPEVEVRPALVLEQAQQLLERLARRPEIGSGGATGPPATAAPGLGGRAPPARCGKTSTAPLPPLSGASSTSTSPIGA